MKRILGTIVAAGLLATAPAAFARVDVFFSFVIPAPVHVAPAPVYVAPSPVYVTPAPVYVAPTVRYLPVHGWDPHWRKHEHKHFRHRGFREHRDYYWRSGRH